MVRIRRVDPSSEQVPFARTAHGAAKDGGKVLVIETPPVDELQVGVPGPARPDPPRDQAGRLLPGPQTREFAALGGKAAGEAMVLRRLLGLWVPDDGHPYQPYHRMCQAWRDEHLSQLASTVGGGSVGAGVASVVSSAALQLAASRYLNDLGAKSGDVRMLLAGARLADQSRQSLLSAHALAALEARAKPTKTPADILWEAHLAERAEQGGTT